jgi:hypothetical protein
MKITDEHKFNMKCIAVALVCFVVDIIDGGTLHGKYFNGVLLWGVIGFSFGMIRQNYKENKK